MSLSLMVIHIFECPFSQIIPSEHKLSVSFIVIDLRIKIEPDLACPFKLLVRHFINIETRSLKQV